MSRNRSTVDMAERWAQLTGTPLQEARQRVRVLRLDGLLPDSRANRTPLTDEQTATFIIAAMNDMHLTAPEMVRSFAKLRPDVTGEELTPFVARLARLPLVGGVAEILRRSRKGGAKLAVTLTVSTTRTFASIAIVDGDAEPVALTYGSLPDDADGQPWPLQRDVMLAGPVLGRMARMVGESA